MVREAIFHLEPVEVTMSRVWEVARLIRTF